ncbi:MAG TPA: NUDIX domain-containing protein [Thermoanaerobaculia bacterium]
MRRVIDKLAWICLDDRRVLCARSHGQEVYYLPGGKREAGESDEQALLREVSEELSVALDPRTIRPLGVFEAPAHGKPGVLVRMTCYTAEMIGEPKASAEIAELAWLTYADRQRLSLVGQIIFDALHGKGML